MNSVLPSRRNRRGLASRLISGAALFGAATLGAGFLVAATSATAGAVTNVSYVVTSNANAPGTCPAVTLSPCTLQTAVADYDALPSGDAATITFSGGGSPSTVAYVETSDNTSGTASGSPNSSIFPSTPTAGDTVVVMLAIGGTASTVSNISGLGASWTSEGSVDLSGGYTDVMYSGVVGGSPTNSLSVTNSTGSTWYVAGDEFSGVGSVGGYKSGTADSNSASLTMDPAAGQGVDIWGNTFSSASSSPGAPWTDHNGGFSGNNTFGAEEVASSSGNVTATWPQSSTATWATNGVLLSPMVAGTYSIAGTGLTFDNPNDVPLTVTGNGAGTTVIDGGGTADDLDFTTGSPVTIASLTIQHVADLDGAIEINGGALTLTSDTLTNNTVGGAIFELSGSLNGSGLTVTENNSQSGGGGIGLVSPSTATLSSSTVSDNTANGEGGGIDNDGGSVSLSSVTVSGNQTTTGGSPSAGGGVANVGGQLTASNSTISGNTATGSGTNDGLGGGLYASGGKSTNLNVVTVSGNTATGTGTGDGLGGGIYTTGTTLFANSVTVSGNTAAGDTTTGAGGDGGGIYKTGSATFSLVNSSVTGNSATGTNAEGGGVDVAGGPMTGTNDSFTSNNATGTGAEGGGVYLDGSSTGLVEDTFSSNQASGTNASGGGIYIAGGSSTLNDTLITLNKASQNGGGVDVAGGSTVLNSSTVSNNTATSGNGGGIYQSAGTLSMNSDTITGNKAVAGGGISKAGGSTYESPNTRVTGNTPPP